MPKKTIELRKDWPKGYSRKGAALELLERYEDAIKTYEVGLQLDPSNNQLKEALLKCKDNLDSQRFGGPGGDGPVGFNPFSDPRLLANLAMNPKTRDLLNDPEVQNLVQGLQKNPDDFSKLLNHPKASQLLGAMLGGMGGMSDANGSPFDFGFGDEKEKKANHLYKITNK